MTNPIPGADSERDLFEQAYGPKESFAWRNESGTYKVASLQLAWELWQKARADRAATKIGANVAADSIANDPKFQRALATYWQNSTEESRSKLIGVIDRRIAAGAPAETPKPVLPGDWSAEFDKFSLPDTIKLSSVKWGGVFLSKPAQGDIQLAALAYHLAEDAIAAQPAPIAGDVEKDATRLDFLMENHPLINGGTAVGYFVEGHDEHGEPVQITPEMPSRRQALDAAMLANQPK